jgi:hypothetical protein
MAERVGASLGKSSPAASIFERARDICNGGVLFSLPALIANGLLKHTATYFNLPDGYYTLNHLFIGLAFIVLLRIQTIEAIKSYSPGELGKLIGLDRIPEIKTIRSKPGILASKNRSSDWSSELSKYWMRQESNICGLLYVDGHVRVYHGKQSKLPRRNVAREKLCLRGMSDYWLNDALGRPFFVITTVFNSGLLSMLRSEIIPRLLLEVPDQPSEEELASDYETGIQNLSANMFARWSQENFFKYMRENFGIDRLIEYEMAPIDETKKVKNPQYSKLEREIRSLAQKLTRKTAEFGAIILAQQENKDVEEEEKEEEKEIEIEKMKKYVIRKAELNEVIELDKEKLEKLKTKRKETQKYIAISQLPENEKFSSLANKKKHIMDNIKMIAYRAETAMANIIRPVMAKRKESRKLLRQIFTTEIDLEPDYENNTLYVVLHSLTNEKSNKIAQYLCKQLNQAETIFPDTNLKLSFKLVSSTNLPGQVL